MSNTCPLKLPPVQWTNSQDAFLSTVRKKHSGVDSMALLWNQIWWRTPRELDPVQKALKTLMDMAVRSRSERVVCAWCSLTMADDDNNAEFSKLAPLLMAQADSVVVLPDPSSTQSQFIGVKAVSDSGQQEAIVKIARINTKDGISIAEVSFNYLSTAAKDDKYKTLIFDLGDYPDMERSLPLFESSWSPDTGLVVFLGSLRPATLVAAIGYCDLNNICISGMLNSPGDDLLINVSIRTLDEASEWIINQDVDGNDWFSQGRKTLEMRRDVSEGIWDLYMNYNTREVVVALLCLVMATFGAWQVQTGAFHFLFALVSVDQLREECGLFRVIFQRRLRPFPKWGSRSRSSPEISGNPVLKLGGVEPFSHTLLVVSLGIVEAVYEITDSPWAFRYTLAVGVFWAAIWILDLIWMVNITPNKKMKFREIGIDFGPSDPRQSFEAILGSNAIALSRVKVGSSRYVDSDENAAAWLTACKNPEVARRLHNSGWASFARGSTDLSADIGDRWLLCGSMPNSSALS